MNSTRPEPPARTCGPNAGWCRCRRTRRSGSPATSARCSRWPGLSRKGRRRAAHDLLRRSARTASDETLGVLLRRRLGDEATDRAVAPLLAGLYAGDVDRLSVRATFPDLERWESWQGSLIRGAQAATRQSRKSRSGPHVRAASGRRRSAHRCARRTWLRSARAVASAIDVTEDGTASRSATGPRCDAVRDRDACRRMRPRACWRIAAPVAAADLAGIAYASTGVVLMVYGDDTQSRAARREPGSWCLAAQRPMTAATWLSSKWPDDVVRDPGGGAVLRRRRRRGGHPGCRRRRPDRRPAPSTSPRWCRCPDMPQHAAVVRWPASMPQYEVGHSARVARIRRRCPQVSSWWARPTTAWASPIACARPARRRRQVLAHLADE